MSVRPRISYLVQVMSALLTPLTPLLLALAHPTAPWWAYILLTAWPLALLLAGAYVSGSYESVDAPPPPRP